MTSEQLQEMADKVAIQYLGPARYQKLLAKYVFVALTEATAALEKELVEANKKCVPIISQSRGDCGVPPRV